MTPARMAAELAGSVDGPHREDRTTGAADLAAESVRYLIYATGRPAGLPYPATVYAVAGSLSLAAGRLGQLMANLGGYLNRELAAGRLGQDNGADPAGAVDPALYHLSAAARAAGELAAALSAVQSDLSATRYLPGGAR